MASFFQIAPHRPISGQPTPTHHKRAATARKRYRRPGHAQIPGNWLRSFVFLCVSASLRYSPSPLLRSTSRLPPGPPDRLGDPLHRLHHPLLQQGPRFHPLRPNLPPRAPQRSRTPQHPHPAPSLRRPLLLPHRPDLRSHRQPRLIHPRILQRDPRPPSPPSTEPTPPSPTRSPAPTPVSPPPCAPAASATSRTSTASPGPPATSPSPGTDSGRIVRCVFYYGSAGENIYAHPVEGIVAHVNVTTRKVIDWTDIDRNAPIPRNHDDYGPADLRPYRGAPAPLHVTQPEGPGFTLNGNEVTWQKWHFRFGLHPREGLVLYRRL